MRRLAPPALATLAALVPLAITAQEAPARTIAGAFVTLTVVPALQVLAGAFVGQRAALGLGALVAALSLLLVAGRPPAVALQETQWHVTLTGQDVVAHAALAPPPGATAARLLSGGGRALLFVCLTQGGPTDVDVRLDGAQLEEAAPAARTPPAECWKQFAVPSVAVAGPARVLDVAISPRPGATLELVGGYTRPRDYGGRSGGAELSVAGRRVRDDLSASTPGAQVGRYFVELRVFDAGGRLAEIWY